MKDYDALVLGGPRDTKTTLHYHKRLAPCERSLDEMQSVCISSAPLSQLWTESFYPASGALYFSGQQESLMFAMSLVLRS